MSKFLGVLLIYLVSLCHVFTPVLLAAEPVLSTTVLNTTGVCESWEELGRALMLSCIVELLDLHLRTGVN